MNQSRANTPVRQIGFYAAVAALVLAYVGLTAQESDRAKIAQNAATADSELRARPSAPTQSLARRSALGASAVALWIVVDLFVARALANRDAMTFYLVRVLLGWGALLALGALLSPGNQRLVAAAIVFGVTAAFVGLWISALSARRRFKGNHEPMQAN